MPQPSARGQNGLTPPHLRRQYEMGPPRPKYIYRDRPRRVRQGYSLTGTHGYSWVLTRAHGCTRGLTGCPPPCQSIARVLTALGLPVPAHPPREGCRRLARGYLFGFCLASGRAVWQHKDAYAPKRSPQAGTAPSRGSKWERLRGAALSGNGRGYAGVGRSLCIGLAWRLCAGLRRRRSTLGFGTSTAAATAPCARPTLRSGACVGPPCVPRE